MERDQRCRQCDAQVERAAHFCSQCGSSLRKTSDQSPAVVTQTVPTVTTVTCTDAPASTPNKLHLSRDEGRFAPGSLIAERYRLISLLGRGGMGEVESAMILESQALGRVPA